jgi:multiple sugar transport system permease protein
MILKRINRRKRSEWITAYSFLLPNIAGLSIFIFFPIVYAFYVSLHDWNLLSPKEFSGFENYIKLANDQQWWRSVGRTLLYALIYVPSLFCLSLFFAAVLASLKGRLVNSIRTMYLMPFAITSVISAVIWMFLLDERNGFINNFLGYIGVASQPFLGSTSQALLSIIVVMIWINLGYNMIIFLANIKDIPKDYYEAARIDGASKPQMFRHITFPLLREISIFIMVVTTIGSFQIFDQIQVMTKGGPANSTEVSVLYIYKQAFQLLDMGYASSLAFILFIMIFILSILQLRMFSAKE